MSRGRTYVIEQDQHLQNLRKIIKRDFYGGQVSSTGASTLPLNQYLSNYKSNQNQHFAEMVQTNRQQWRKQHWWFDKQDKMLMLAGEGTPSLPYHNMLEKNPEKNGISTAVVKQDAKNSFFFNRDKNYGSLQSQEYRLSKKVVYGNCRLEDAVSRMKREIQVKKEERTPIKGNQRVSKNNEKWQEQSNNQSHRHSQRASQTPAHQNDAHLMTWGQIQSTPLRISGPQFKIPQTPQRQALLLNLSSKITKQKIYPSKKSEQVMRLLGSLTPSLRTGGRSSAIRRGSVKRQSGDVGGLLDIGK